MKKTVNATIAFFAAVIVLISMATPIFAAETVHDWWSTTIGYQVENDASAYYTSGAVTVYLNVHGKGYESDTTIVDKHYTVILGNSSTGSRLVSVRDVLIQAMADHSEISFQDVDGDPITSSSESFYQVEYNNTTYAPSSYTAKNGWMIRVNKKIVIESGTPGLPRGSGGAEGLTIGNTYVKGGYIVDAYFDNVNNNTNACYFTRVKEAGYDPSTHKLTTVKVDAARDWFTPEDNYLTWEIENFSVLENATVKLYDSTNTCKATATTGSDGKATFNYELSPGAYRIDVVRTAYTNKVYTKFAHAQAHIYINNDYSINWRTHE